MTPKILAFAASVRHGSFNQQAVELAAAGMEVELYTQLVEINRSIAEFLSSAAERGEASRLDVAGARLAGKALEQKSKAAGAAAERWRGELRPLLGAALCCQHSSS